MKRLFWIWILLLVGWLAPAQGQEANGTYFIDGAGTFDSAGDWQTQQFTIYHSTTFMMRVASDYNSQYSIITPDQLDNFCNNRAFTGYGNFSSSFGYHSVTLPTGTYYAAVRSMVSSANSYRWELDFVLNVPNYYVAANGIHAASYVNPNGGKLYHRFTVQNGFLYYMDGCNSGVTTDVIPASSLNAYLNGQTFNYYPSLSGSGSDEPGFYRLRLPAGAYYLCFQNDESFPRAVTYLMQIYARRY